MTGSVAPIEAVLFDFGGVFIGSPFAAIADVGAELGLDAEQSLELAFGPYDRDTDHPWHRAERGEVSFAEARAAVLELSREHGVELDLLELAGRLGGGAVHDEMVACVRRVRAGGRATAIVTNNIAEARDCWRPLLPLDELFDAVIDSCEVGIRKPDPRIFELALTALGGIDAERAVFLDDYPGNVAAAEALGMVGVLVEPDITGAIAHVDRLVGASR